MKKRDKKAWKRWIKSDPEAMERMMRAWHGNAVPGVAKTSNIEEDKRISTELEKRGFSVPQVFLPKDRDGALALIKRELYQLHKRTQMVAERHYDPDSRATSDTLDIRDNIRNLLDIIERS